MPYGASIWARRLTGGGGDALGAVPGRAARALDDPRAWMLAALLAGSALFGALGLRLAGRLPLAGDEPWYAAQAYALWHHHTPVIFSPHVPRAVYEPLLRGTPDDHTRDYLGQGERVLVNLPGYAAVIAPFFALGGRALVVLLQALVAAATGALLVGEAWRVFGSRVMVGVAWAAYALTLPVQVYVGQLFPSTLAACAIFGGFVMTRRLREAGRGESLLLGPALGTVAALLPWLHAKYTLPALTLALLGIVALRPRWPARDRADRRALWSVAAIAALMALSLALIALYSHRYFGSWTLPNARTQPDLAHPRFGEVITLFEDMLFGQQSGLLPWVPVDLVVVAGLVLLARERPHVGWPVVALLAALAAAFLPAAVTPVFQGKALPGRFTLEWAPFCALGVAAVFDWGWCGAKRNGVWFRRVALAGVAALLLVSGWFAWVGQWDPARLYPASSGNRLAAEYPQALPLLWFRAFASPPGQWVERGHVVFAPLVHTSDAWHTQTLPLLAPPGRYRATFVLTCRGSWAETATVRIGVLTLRQRAGVQHVAATMLACRRPGESHHASLGFASDGYHALAFTLAGPAAAALRDPQVTYGPA